MKLKHQTKKENVTKVIQYVDLGFSDYLAARILLLNKQLLQGAIIASTSIEKYIKAIAAFCGNSCPGHLKKAHLNLLNNFDPNFYKKLNESFLKCLIKCYKLRYLDNISFGYSISIRKRQFLAELDYSVNEFHKRLIFSSNKRGRLKTRYDSHYEEKNNYLYDSNFLINKIPKKKFIEQEDDVYGILFDNKMGIIEVNYVTPKGIDDGNFLKPGLKKQEKKF